MNPLTKEWIAKAEGDFNTAQRELSAAKQINYDAVCFHSQQCAEKYLKARLVEEKINFTKTHDLGTILDQLINIEPNWGSIREKLNSLTNMAVEVRYPGNFADANDAAEALEIANKVRDLVRETFRLQS